MPKPQVPSSFRSNQIAVGLLGVVCVLAVILNYEIRRGPVHDAQAVNDLQEITTTLQSAYGSTSNIPASLQAIRGLRPALQNRLSAYQYTRFGPASYQLCATFSAASPSSIQPQYQILGVQPDPSYHGAGKQCFNFRLDQVNSGSSP